MPSVDGEARGFFKRDWKAIPAKPSPHPERIAATMRGNRMLQITVSMGPSACLRSALTTPDSDRS
jgi:hypothetical protein